MNVNKLYIDKIRFEAYHINSDIDKNRFEVINMEHIYIEDAKVFKAFCDENRLQILALLRSGEKCACKLLENLNIGQSTLSHHMKILCDSGVVRSRIEGKWTHYSLSEDGISYAKRLLKELTAVNTITAADFCDCDNKTERVDINGNT